MSKADDNGRGRAVAQSLISRRNFIIAAMAGGLSLSELVSAIGGSDGKGTLWGGTLALSKSFNVAGDLYIGPDSTKSNVAANSGRVFLASDTQEVFYGDSGTWVSLGTIGGGGSAIEVQEDGSQLTTGATLFDFKAGVTASEPVADEIDVDVDESEISLANLGSRAHGDLSNAPEEAHHPRGGYSRGDVTTTSTTASPWDSLWVDTSAAGAAVTVTLPADGDTADGDQVRVVVEDATNSTDVTGNTGQSIIGNNPTLNNAGDALEFEFKSSTSTWAVV